MRASVRKLNFAQDAVARAVRLSLILRGNVSHGLSTKSTAASETSRWLLHVSILKVVACRAKAGEKLLKKGETR